MSADTTTAALRILRSDDVMDAADRYLKFCRASSSMEIRHFFPPNPKFYDFESEGLTPSLDWINLDIIYEAENSVKYLRIGHNITDGWSTERAVLVISAMLRGLRSKKMREDIQSHHNTREHSAAILETLRPLIGSGASRHGANLETQTKFVRLVKVAITPPPNVPPLAFPVAKILLQVFDEFDHTIPITQAIGAIRDHQWLLSNFYPVETTVQRLNSKLIKLSGKNTPNDPAWRLRTLSGPGFVSPVTVNA
ncbi:hypothetical protein BD410DRAFT_845285 [Rickenella mellea]|uniref:Uncharacterized protein n=1 Tax=Rickenella mellea TaxID=50990 RepID=A0A4Y7PK20_9AGAM|nr:hypothetical protein BD410DRAFT_845285 [Rickenella mellea]